jgi:hypothetical protein
MACARVANKQPARTITWCSLDFYLGTEAELVYQYSRNITPSNELATPAQGEDV